MNTKLRTVLLWPGHKVPNLDGTLPWWKILWRLPWCIAFNVVMYPLAIWCCFCVLMISPSNVGRTWNNITDRS